jgi:hypothetical protein
MGNELHKNVDNRNGKMGSKKLPFCAPILYSLRKYFGTFFLPTVLHNFIFTSNNFFKS